ncbi:EAL domain-containing protein [Motiliproteus sp.]|uniref:EAL domain-containing protein n=1 Tax=Motiliproteus sp. TaxID=1898955 RepID=UPI003BA95592
MTKLFASIARKLVWLAGLNATAFVVIALIVSLAFVRVEDLSTRIVGGGTERVINNALLGRQISLLFAEIDILSRQCSQKSYQPSQAEQLTQELQATLQRVPNPALNQTIATFERQTRNLFQQCLQLNQRVKQLRRLGNTTEYRLDTLEQAIGQNLVDQTLAGKSTNHLDQQMTLVAGLRETLLLIGRESAEQLAFAKYNDSSTLGAVGRVDDMSLRLQTLIAATPEVAEASRLLDLELANYRSAVLRYRKAIIGLEAALESSLTVKKAVLGHLQQLDKAAHSEAETIKADLSRILRTANAQVLALGVAIALLSLLLINRINRHSIRKPMAETLRLIKSIKQNGTPSTPAGREDEWGEIQESLTGMAQALKQSQTEVLQARDRLEMALAGANDGLWDWNLETDEVYYSPRWKSMLGYDPDELADRLKTWAKLVDPAQKDQVLKHVSQYLEGETPTFAIEFRMRHKQGHWVDILSRAQIAVDANGNPCSPRRLVGTHSDITDRKLAERELKRSEGEKRSLIDALPDIVMRFARDGSHLFVSENVRNVTPFQAEEFIGKTHQQLGFPEHLCQLWESAIDKTFRTACTQELEFSLEGPSGPTVFNMKLTPDIDEDNQVRSVLTVARDITQLKQHQKRLEQIAHFDVLTGLPNRVLLADRLLQSMSQCQRRGMKLAVVYIDLDGFKAVNDQYGHHIGDHLLSVVARRMSQALRDEDTLARLGGDEFVAVLIDLQDGETAEPILHRLLEAAAREVEHEGASLSVSASMGVTFYPQFEEIDADQLLRQADQAMYQAKLSGRSQYHLFDMAHDQAVRGHLETIERIRTALTAEELCLYYQPKVNMESGQVIGMEALIRWQHPTEGLLSPASFLPLIEEDPLNIDVGDWVLKRAMEQSAIWHAKGLALTVSVNVSAMQIQQSDFVEKLATLLQAYPTLPARLLELEILETSTLNDLSQTSRVIRQCRALGVKVAIDDFGTGYSSLTYLKQLPADTVKIDQSFVRELRADSDNLAIIEGIMGLAKAFQREVIAEGVETTEQGHLLLALGCRQAQGYAIARPMPAGEVSDWINQWRSPPSWLAHALSAPPTD